MPLQQRTWRVYCLRLSHMRYKRKRDKCFWTMARSYLHDYMQEKGSNRRTKNPVLRNGTAVQKSYDSRYEKENFRAIQQMMCKGHLFCRHTTKSIENFGFRCFFFVAKTKKMVRAKMWVNCLTHIVTHMRKCTERVKEYRRGSCFLSGALLACGTYRICAMKLPIFSAAFCCICRVTWV